MNANPDPNQESREAALTNASLRKVMCTVRKYSGQHRYEILINDGNHLAEMVSIVQLIDGEEVQAYLFTGDRLDGYPLLALDIEFPGIKGRPRNVDKC